jgi:signal transduction histidine kinase
MPISSKLVDDAYASTAAYRYGIAGALFGFLFPAVSILFEMGRLSLPIGFQSISVVHSLSPLLFVIDTAPLFLGMFATLAGLHRRTGYDLEKHRTNLEGLVASRTETLEETNEQLRKEIEERELAKKERKKLEQQLRQAQKMEAVGQLTGGIAHDFNNILTAIIGYAELSLEDMGGEDPVRENVVEINKAAEQAASLVRQLLAFSRQQVICPTVIDLNETLRNSRGILDRIIGEDVELAFLIEPNLWPVKLDTNQVDQILFNLAENAREALPDGGKLSIRSENVVLDEPFVAEHLGSSLGEFVKVVVRDDGCGMPPEVLKRVFEPFYSTKPDKKGSGLGLSTVYGIVKQNKGYIEIASTVDQGTQIAIYFPRTIQNAEAS